MHLLELWDTCLVFTTLKINKLYTTVTFVLLSKRTRKSFPTSRPVSVFDLLNLDVWGQFHVLLLMAIK